jgi:hypothetical protein
VRDVVETAGATPESAPAAFQPLYFAEGSDWFWWFGADQESGNDDEFDDLYRTHLRNVYRALDVTPPEEFDQHIVPHVVLWTFTQPVSQVQPGDLFTVRTNCPGVLTWSFDDQAPQRMALVVAGGVMAGIQRYHAALGAIPPGIQQIRFRFRCTYAGCGGQDICSSREDHVVRVVRVEQG